MKKGVRETHKKRFALLRQFLDMDLPCSTQLEIMEPLIQAPEEEKESVAAQILEDLLAGKYDL